MQELITQHEAEFSRITAQMFELEERRKEIRTILATLNYLQKQEADNAARAQDQEEKRKE